MDINKNNIDEWHERFVLGLLNEEELKHYKAYLNTTPGAREEQREWANIIRDVQTAAHADMKREIRRQAEQRKYHDSPYILWYRVAAILFFIVLLPAVIYFNYPGAVPPLTRIESATNHKSAEKEMTTREKNIDNKEAGSQILPEPETPVLSPPPARPENAGYGSAGTRPPAKLQNNASPPVKNPDTRKMRQKIMPPITIPAQQQKEQADISGQHQAFQHQEPLSTLQALSSPASDSRSNLQDIHPPALPKERSSRPVLIRGKSGRTYRISFLLLRSGKSATDSIGYLLRESSADTRLILINLPEKLTRLLKKVAVDDSNGEELILTFPGNIRYRVERGRQTGQARRIR